MVLEGVPMLGNHLPGNILDIIALIAIFRKLAGQTQQFQISGPGGLAEHPHLSSGIIKIIFTEDIMAGGRQQTGNGITKDGLAAMTDTERAGGIGTDELHHYLSAIADSGKTKLAPAVQALGKAPAARLLSSGRY